MLEKKHLVFLAGATAPSTPPLCTALITTKLESNSPVTFVTHKLLPAVLLGKPGLLAQGDLGAFLGLSTNENNITLH